MMLVNEAETRRKLIDPALKSAGWDVDNPAQVGIEIPVDGISGEPWNGVTDYCLYRSNGEIIAVVEAKKRSRDPNVAREQVAQYVAKIPQKQAQQTFTPFAFFSNGIDTYFKDPETNAPPRLVAGFFTPADLERLLYLRQNQRPFEQTTINAAIAGRTYQQLAIRKVIEAFAQNRRRALLVMATGTGKTRTTVALADLFLRANQARKVLFLADRDALVDQALRDGFQDFLPGEPSARIFSHTYDPTKRLYVATLQTMNNIFPQFSPAAFDLIVVDEAHRSIFNKASEIWDYFDARMIGLTATPAEFIDRDTFRIFDCPDHAPTFLYTFREAVDEKHLVDFHLYKAKTGFQRDGIKGVDLSEEAKNSLIEQGIDPEELDYSGTELEKTVSNKDTLRQQWEEFMEVCTKDASGMIPCKSIVFAMTQEHAKRLLLTFEEMYPQYANMAQIITSDTERVRDGSWGDGLISKFKKNDMPRIAISVDMLDTGIDVPEVMNLAFMKPVQSRIKLWQMIGRGTRNDEACKYRDRLPERGKTEFKIIDFWQNDFERQTEDATPTTLPVLVTIFNTRLKILESLLSQQNAPDAAQVKADLRRMIDRIPRDSFAVKRVLPEIEEAWADEFWNYLTVAKVAHLRAKVGPLLRLASAVDVAAETFTSKMERLKLQILQKAPKPDLLQSIAEDVSLLPDFVQKDAATKAVCELCLSPNLRNATFAQLTDVIEALAPEMKNRRERQSAFVTLDLPDIIAERGYITLSENGERVYVQEYRRRVEERIRPLTESHPTIAALREGREVTDEQLVVLERTLRENFPAPDAEATLINIRRAYGFQVGSFLAFLRHLLTLEGVPDYETIVRREWERHIAVHVPAYTADQIQFLRVVEEVFVRKGRLDLADLYDDAAIARLGANRVERLFTEPQIKELLAVSDKLAV